MAFNALQDLKGEECKIETFWKTIFVIYPV
jgi:hypothetical protein